jgi:glycosyltransferase involved in cell wall biosynthesis
MMLTVVIPTLNEEKDLPRTLKSLKFADEILVVDTGSTDRTVQTAKEFGCKVVTHPFKGYADVRNFADQQAKHNWILSIDADVVVPPELAQEITQLSPEPSVYKIGRINIIWNKPVLHADWGPSDDKHIRLYYRKLGHWSSDVHEQFVTSTKPKELKNLLVHYNYESVTEFVSKVNSYSEIEAKKRISSKQDFSFLKMIYQAKYDFFKRYFYKLGLMDGYHGLFLSYLQGIYYLVVGIKQKTETHS